MNLQLFAVPKTYLALTDGSGSTKKKDTSTSNKKPNTDVSIVDYLNSQGKDASYSARKELAKELGISNYKGTAEQNTTMLNTLKNGTTAKPNTPKPSPTTTNTAPSTAVTPSASTATTNKNTTAPAVSTISGVDKSVADKMASTYTASDRVSSAQSNASSALNKLNSIPAPSVSKETMQAMNTPFSASSAYLEAMNYTNSLLEKLSSGRTSYTDQIKDMMSQIQNRDKFSYDVDTDMLFQQALASSMASGQQAMQDTMGQASALTGGYASTYAQSAGNQAYNAYIQDAYNNLPEYYQMAMDAYNMEGQDMYNQLAMLGDADAQEYQRMYDSWNSNFANAQNMYSQEYGAWQDSVNNAYNSANLQLQQQGMAYDQAYNTYGAMQNNADTLYSQEYQRWQDEVNNAFNMAGMQNSDFWNSADQQYRYDSMANDNYWNGVDNEYRYDVMENDNYWNEQDNIYRDNALAQDDRHYRQDMLYKNNALAQDQNQFNARYDVNGDGVVNYLDNADTDESEADESLKEPTETQKQKALKAFNEGGEDAYYQYIDSLPSNIDVEAIDLYVNGDGEETSGYGSLPLEQRTFTKSKDTVNGLWGVDKNDIVVDQYGNEYRIDALPESLRKSLTKLKKGESYTAK